MLLKLNSNNFKTLVGPEPLVENYYNIMFICKWFSHQCRRRACRKADSPSMTSKIETVSMAKMEKMIDSTTDPT